MATAQTLVPTVLSPDDVLTDLTTLVQTVSESVLQFSNSGRELLVLQATAASQTVTVSIGATVLGQPVQSFSQLPLPYSGTAGDIVLLGPFHSQLEAAGTSTVTVTLTDATSKVALIQVPGVS